MRVLPDSEAKRQKYILVEQYLDAGHGACHLRNPQCAEIVQNGLFHFAGLRYDLHAWCVMPNHVHTLFTPLPDWSWSEIADVVDGLIRYQFGVTKYSLDDRFVEEMNVD